MRKIGSKLRNNMKIAVVIPCLNLWSTFTWPAIQSLQSVHQLDIIVIDNGSTDITEHEALILASQHKISHYIRNSKNEGVSYSWNQGIRIALEDNCDYILIINNDVVLRKDTIDNLVEAFEQKQLVSPELNNGTEPTPIVMITAINVRNDCQQDPVNLLNLDIEPYKKNESTENPDFSCFMINKHCYQKVGEFDQAFSPAYWEDNDYHHRINLSGLKAINCPSALYYHYGSRTRTDNAVGITVTDWQFHLNERYYSLKWGGRLGAECHKYPFNDPTRQLSWVYQHRCKADCHHNPRCATIMPIIGA
jgi:GT2 family glycosyltransferase